MAMNRNGVERADRVLVWLWLITLVFGGLATTVVVFGADTVLGNVSHPSAPVDDMGHMDMPATAPTGATAGDHGDATPTMASGEGMHMGDG
jgi:hypothetical protein